MNQSLYFEEYGESGHPVIIFLHGLLGSSRNWRSVAQALSSEYKIYTLDLPEHGSSPHTVSTNLSSMSEQVGAWIDGHLGGEYILCGHSLGGKVAMAHAISQPTGLKGLVVVDIAPRDYPAEHHLPTLNALLDLELTSLKSRKDADEKLSRNVSNWAFRQFLLTNLKEEKGKWSWRANLSTLHASMAELSRNPLSQDDSYKGPSLFIRGGKSGYLRTEHFPLVMEAFPDAEIVTLPDAGHDVHVEDKAGFLVNFKRFLDHIR